MHYVPHTDDEIASMLEFIGVESLDHLFDMVPDAIRLAGGLDIAAGVSEFDVLSDFENMANNNRADLVCFAGGGAYDHELPSAVKRLANRTEFVTSYTPYQPEVAQGVLQALFEYQTLVARLSGLEVSNASLYDGGTACVEAINLSVAATGNSRVVVSRGVHPNWRHVMRTMAAGTAHDIVEIDIVEGVTSWSDTAQPAGAVVVQYPNFLGNLEDLAAARDYADACGAKLVVAFDHLAAGIVKSPGEWGADVVVGEGQCFGTPMALGGPYLGLFSCNLNDVRRLPGRVVGETVDLEGKRSYVTTLRTREQDIRREKASSNICTNQTLIAVTAAIQLGWLGSNGIRDMALRCARGARYTRDALLDLDGVECHSNAATLREFAVRLPVDPVTVIDRMMDEGFLAGIALDEEYGSGLLVAVTEKRTKIEIDAYVTALGKVLQ
jgi:glycine dehydrogenase subunit 1